MRTYVLAAILSSASPVLADAPKPPAPSQASDDLPLPKDASAPKDAPGGGGGIKFYQVNRPRPAVLTEMRDLWKKAGWTISKDAPAEEGRAIRLELTHNGKLWKVSFTGDATRTAIIVTAP